MPRSSSGSRVSSKDFRYQKVNFSESEDDEDVSLARELGSSGVHSETSACARVLRGCFIITMVLATAGAMAAVVIYSEAIFPGGDNFNNNATYYDNRTDSEANSNTTDLTSSEETQDNDTSGAGGASSPEEDASDAQSEEKQGSSEEESDEDESKEAADSSEEGDGGEVSGKKGNGNGRRRKNKKKAAGGDSTKKDSDTNKDPGPQKKADTTPESFDTTSYLDWNYNTEMEQQDSGSQSKESDRANINSRDSLLEERQLDPMEELMRAMMQDSSPQNDKMGFQAPQNSEWPGFRMKKVTDASFISEEVKDKALDDDIMNDDTDDDEEESPEDDSEQDEVSSESKSEEDNESQDDDNSDDENAQKLEEETQESTEPQKSFLNVLGRNDLFSLGLLVSITVFTCSLAFCCFVRLIRQRKRQKRQQFSRLINDLNATEKFAIVDPSESEDDE